MLTVRVYCPIDGVCAVTVRQVSSVCQSVTDTPTPTKTRWRPVVLALPTRGGKKRKFPGLGVGGRGGFLAHQYCQTTFQPFCLTVRFAPLRTF
jgi:hypothetical protein